MASPDPAGAGLRAKNLTKADYEALAAFRRAVRQFLAFSEAAARGAALTPQQHQALLAIKGAAGREWLAIGEIAAALGVRPHTAVGLVDRIAQLGLVDRRQDPNDHRRVRVALSEKGEELLRDLSADHFGELRAIRPMLVELLARFDSENK